MVRSHTECSISCSIKLKFVAMMPVLYSFHLPMKSYSLVVDNLFLTAMIKICSYPRLLNVLQTTYSTMSLGYR